MATRRTRQSRLEAAKAKALRLYHRRAHRASRTTHLVTADPRSNVVGVGIGNRIKGGQILPTKVIHIYVIHKLPKSAIASKHMIPQDIEGIPTDVVETGVFRASSTSRSRPAQPGCSIGATSGALSTFGTLGALVRRTPDDGKTYILSCNHVLSSWGTFTQADVLQQANRDGGDAPADVIGSLTTAFPLSSSAKNTIDAAIAALNRTGDVSSVVLAPIGRLASSSPIDAALGMSVEKVGRTTDHTNGTVIATSADFSVDSGDPDIGSFRFTNQIMIRAAGAKFSDLGDSGALIVDQASRRATGLLCAASDSQPMTTACHLREVLRLMRLVLVA